MLAIFQAVLAILSPRARAVNLCLVSWLRLHQIYTDLPRFPRRVARPIVLIVIALIGGSIKRTVSERAKENQPVAALHYLRRVLRKRARDCGMRIHGD